MSIVNAIQINFATKYYMFIFRYILNYITMHAKIKKVWSCTGLGLGVTIESGVDINQSPALIR